MNHPQELGSWLALFHLSLPLKYRHRLLHHYKQPGTLLAAAEPELRKLGVGETALRQLREHRDCRSDGALARQIAASLRWAEQPNHHIVTYNDNHYPEALKQIAAPPLLLFVRGAPALLATMQIGIVGSRHPSVIGVDTARLLARGLAAQGLTVTSGLALGIDGAAHEGALSQAGPTIAVMATGADTVYPRRHLRLAHQIMECGALVTEFPLGTVPKPACFPQRNRIISGLSLGVLVVEAGLPSGSLITARYALEQNREVFAVPGSIHSPTSKGCHALLRQGAKLVESVEDVIEELALQLAPCPVDVGRHRAKNEEMPALNRKVLALVGYQPVSVDSLAEHSGLPVAEVNQALMQLELEQEIKSVPGGVVRCLD